MAVGDLVGLVIGDQTKLEAFLAASLMPLIMGFLAGSLFRITRRLGADSRWAAVIAVGSAFGTYALPYGKDFFAEPLTTLGIVLSIEFLIVGRYELTGVALAVAVTTRPESVVLVAVLPIIVWVFRGFRDAFAYGAIAAIGAVVDAVYDQYRFGSIAEERLRERRVHHTISARCGRTALLSREERAPLTAPIVILVVLGSIRLWTAKKRFVVHVTLANLLVFFVLSATWHSWQGGWSWGPRLLLPGVIPSMVLLSPLTKKERRVGIGLLAAGFVVSASTILVPTRAQQLDHPLPSVGPGILRQYRLIPAATRYSVDHLRNATPGDSR